MFPIKLKTADVMALIKLESATYRNCSQLFHNCLKRNIGSCRSGNFPDDQGWQLM